jgi:hypothetical protein
MEPKEVLAVRNVRQWEKGLRFLSYPGVKEARQSHADHVVPKAT